MVPPEHRLAPIYDMVEAPERKARAPGFRLLDLIDARDISPVLAECGRVLRLHGRLAIVALRTPSHACDGPALGVMRSVLPQARSACPFEDERDELTAAAERRCQGSIGPAFGVLGAQLVDQPVTFGSVARRDPVGLGRFRVEFAGAGGPGIGRTGSFSRAPRGGTVIGAAPGATPVVAQGVRAHLRTP